MRKLCAALIASTLLAGSAIAAEAPQSNSNGPLAPGKPAGVQKAQTDNTLLYTVVGLGLVAAGIVIVTAGDSDGPLVSGVATATTP